MFQDILHIGGQGVEIIKLPVPAIGLVGFSTQEEQEDLRHLGNHPAGPDIHGFFVFLAGESAIDHVQREVGIAGQHHQQASQVQALEQAGFRLHLEDGVGELDDQGQGQGGFQRAVAFDKAGDGFAVADLGGVICQAAVIANVEDLATTWTVEALRLPGALSERLLGLGCEILARWKDVEFDQTLGL